MLELLRITRPSENEIPLNFESQYYYITIIEFKGGYVKCRLLSKWSGTVYTTDYSIYVITKGLECGDYWI